MDPLTGHRIADLTSYHIKALRLLHPPDKLHATRTEGILVNYHETQNPFVDVTLQRSVPKDGTNSTCRNRGWHQLNIWVDLGQLTIHSVRSVNHDAGTHLHAV